MNKSALDTSLLRFANSASSRAKKPPLLTHLGCTMQLRPLPSIIVRTGRHHLPIGKANVGMLLWAAVVISTAHTAATLDARGIGDVVHRRRIAESCEYELVILDTSQDHHAVERCVLVLPTCQLALLRGHKKGVDLSKEFGSAAVAREARRRRGRQSVAHWARRRKPVTEVDADSDALDGLEHNAPRARARRAPRAGKQAV